MIEVGRDLWRSFCPFPLLRQGHLEQAASVCRCLLNISKEGDSTASQGNLCQCSVTFTVKKCLLQREPPVFQFVPNASGPVTGHC